MPNSGYFLLFFVYLQKNIPNKSVFLGVSLKTPQHEITKHFFDGCFIGFGERFR